MIYGELGIIPVYITIKLRMACFWNKPIQNTNKLSGTMYKVMFHLSNTKNFEFTCLNYVKSIFDDAGLSYIWFVCLFVFYVPSTARSFRDGTPIYCPFRRT